MEVLVKPEISPFDVLFFIVPLVMTIFFYAKSAKTEIDRDKFILFILSVISFIIWAVYVWRFLAHFINKIMYG